MTGDLACALCGQVAPLQQSHIVPKFVSRWIKRTSATGRLRNAGNVRIRHQDGPKQKLLCGGCEQRLSTHERWFAKQVFLPQVEGVERRPSLRSPALLPFVVGLAWRVARTDDDRLARRYRRHARCIRRTLASWGRHLLDSTAPGGHHYLFPLPDMIYTMDETRGVNWYLNRSLDVTTLLIQHRPFVWWKIPGFAGLSSLGGHALPHSGPFRVGPDGLRAQVWDGDAPDLLTQLILTRARDVTARIAELPEHQWDAIARDYRQAGEEWMNSPAASAVRIDALNALPPDSEESP